VLSHIVGWSKNGGQCRCGIRTHFCIVKTVDGNIIIVTVKAEGLYKVTAKYSNKAVVEYTFNAINGN